MNEIKENIMDTIMENNKKWWACTLKMLPYTKWYQSEVDKKLKEMIGLGSIKIKNIIYRSLILLINKKINQNDFVLILEHWIN